jgi:hypothetical protein
LWLERRIRLLDVARVANAAGARIARVDIIG